MLFYHPKEDIKIWMSLWFIYPIFSALPQEIIYRTFIFKRYKYLLPNVNHRLILSCLAFGFLHIIFLNWQAVLLSTCASVIFCKTYMRYKSLLLVTIEHSFLGLIAYTTGIGYYFDSSLIS
jgi:membrane protease YdiL (CAAX protease family)